MIRVKDRRITNGRNSWTVTATISPGRVQIERVEGDVTDGWGLQEAIIAMLNRRLLYRVVLHYRTSPAYRIGLPPKIH